MELFYEENRFYAMDAKGSLLAEITFPFTAPGKVDINHTFVDASLRGQGIADLLMQAAVEKIRKEGWLATTSCSYAAKWMEKHPEHSELLAK